MADPLEMKIEDFSTKNPGTMGSEVQELPLGMRLSRKEYLGDGVYCEFDGWNIKLTAEDGISVTDTVYLDPHTYGALVRYAAKFS